MATVCVISQKEVVSSSAEVGIYLLHFVCKHRPFRSYNPARLQTSMDPLEFGASLSDLDLCPCSEEGE